VRRAPSGRYTLKKEMKIIHHENTSPFEKVLTRMMILQLLFSKMERNEKENESLSGCIKKTSCRSSFDSILRPSLQ